MSKASKKSWIGRFMGSSSFLGWFVAQGNGGIGSLTRAGGNHAPTLGLEHFRGLTRLLAGFVDVVTELARGFFTYAANVREDFAFRLINGNCFTTESTENTEDQWDESQRGRRESSPPG